MANLSFEEGNASDLHDVARKMVRVTTRGGRIVTVNWIPRDSTLISQILRICSATCHREAG
jgi:hypothetical protein